MAEQIQYKFSISIYIETLKKFIWILKKVKFDFLMNFDIADIDLSNKLLIGEGSYGKVYCVINKKTGKKICIKRDS